MHARTIDLGTHHSSKSCGKEVGGQVLDVFWDSVARQDLRYVVRERVCVAHSRTVARVQLISIEA